MAIATFGPIYEELVNALMRKAMYSLNENDWTADQREAFRCYRTDIADTIMYCYNILNPSIWSNMGAFEQAVLYLLFYSVPTWFLFS